MFKAEFLLTLVIILIKYGLTIHPEAHKGFILMANNRGYPAEKHEIRTQDGWILEINRIPHGINTTIPNKYPLILLAGSGGSAEVFLVNGKRSMPYVFARNGYDVWVLNVRGTYQSVHTKFNSSDEKFWDYSLTEMGKYDVASSIDYVINITGSQKVSLVGHSQGSTIIFVLLSTKPEYNAKVNLAIHLAPSAYYDGLKMPFLLLAKKHVYTIEHIFKVVGLYYIPSVKDVLDGLGDLCSVTVGFQTMCSQLIRAMDYGADLNKMYNNSIFPLVLSYMPAGLSIKTFIHYAQIYNRGIFSDYDYGPRENFIRYGNVSPPEFDLRKISAPNALFYSPYDAILPVEGIKKTIGMLQNPIPVEVRYFDFRHVTFIFSKYASIVYPKMLSLLKQYRDK